MGVGPNQQGRDGSGPILWFLSQVLHPVQTSVICWRLALGHLHCLQQPVGPQKPAGNRQPSSGCVEFLVHVQHVRGIGPLCGMGWRMSDSHILLVLARWAHWHCQHSNQAAPGAWRTSSHCQVFILALQSQEKDLRPMTLMCLVRT